MRGSQRQRIRLEQALRPGKQRRGGHQRRGVGSARRRSRRRRGRLPRGSAPRRIGKGRAGDSRRRGFAASRPRCGLASEALRPSDAGTRTRNGRARRLAPERAGARLRQETGAAEAFAGEKSGHKGGTKCFTMSGAVCGNFCRAVQRNLRSITTKGPRLHEEQTRSLCVGRPGLCRMNFAQ